MSATLGKVVRAALEKQARVEINAYNRYQHIANFFEVNNYIGTAKYFNSQAAGELNHSNTLLKHIIDRNQQPTIPAYDEINTNYTELKVPFEEHLEIEQINLDNLNSLAQICLENNDYLAYSIVQGLLNEQLQEFNDAEVIYDKSKAYTSLPGLFYHLDYELGKAA